ncbi:MAG TPA: hypothetical protein VJG49_00010 [Candidatus Nanoarchaeia archaeon]|nr:hypothetical protein [Candidatus Nanoarchaeia archaeon]
MGLLAVLLLILNSEPTVEDTEISSPSRVCTSESTGENIYKLTWCGDDTCWSKFYDAQWNLLEETPEYGPGTPVPYEIKTKVKDCQSFPLADFLNIVPGSDKLLAAITAVQSDATITNCGTAPDGGMNPAQDCFYNSYLTCTPSKMMIKAAGDVDDEFRELLAVSKEENSCQVVKFRNFEDLIGFNVCGGFKAAEIQGELTYYLSDCDLGMSYYKTDPT